MLNHQISYEKKLMVVFKIKKNYHNFITKTSYIKFKNTFNF